MSYLVQGVDIYLGEFVLGEILDVPVDVIRSVINKVPSLKFVQEASNVVRKSKFGVRKKFLKGEFQMLYELINKVLLPHSEKRTISSVVDIFLMNSLSNFEMVNLPGIIIEHMYKVMQVKDWKYGMAYGFLRNKLFGHIKIECSKGMFGSIKHTFHDYFN